MFKRILHIGIAVESLREAIPRFESLGLTCQREEDIPREGVRVAFFPVGESRIELIESTRSDSSIAKFLERRGPGLHHICLETKNLKERILDLKSKGFQFVGEPTPGAEGRVIAFMHPKSLGGVMLELAEKISK